MVLFSPPREDADMAPAPTAFMLQLTEEVRIFCFFFFLLSSSFSFLSSSFFSFLLLLGYIANTGVRAQDTQASAGSAPASPASAPAEPQTTTAAQQQQQEEEEEEGQPLEATPLTAAARAQYEEDDSYEARLMRRLRANNDLFDAESEEDESDDNGAPEPEAAPAEPVLGPDGKPVMAKPKKPRKQREKTEKQRQREQQALKQDSARLVREDETLRFDC